VLENGTYIKPKNAKLAYGSMVLITGKICGDLDIVELKISVVV
jgi:hypothetical protein